MLNLKNILARPINFKHITTSVSSSHSSLILTDDMTYQFMDYQEKDLICDFFNEKDYALILKLLPFKKVSSNLTYIVNKFEMLESYLNISEDKQAMLNILKIGLPNRFESLQYIRQQKETTKHAVSVNKKTLYDITTLSEVLGWNYDKTKQMFYRLCYDCYKAFLEMYEEEFYYMYKVKGTYKQCKKCGEVKLIQRFGELSSSEDGHRDTCKECRKCK